VTAIIRVSPVGLDLASREQADNWVAGFGMFLAELGYQSPVRHVSITVDSAPAGGASSQRDYIAERTDPTAPELARAVMAELAESSPSQAADVDTRVAITFDPSRARPRPEDLFAAAAEVVRRLPALEDHLSRAGVTVLGRASIEWIAERLRVAYDPASRGEPADTEADELQLWSQAGTWHGQETWDYLRHDSGISVAYALREAPRQAITDTNLIPLLSPGPFPRRITMLYEAFPAEAAAAETEKQIAASQIRREIARRTRRDDTQRDLADQARALQAAREEAAGAGVGKFTFYISTTVLREDDLPSAKADIEQRAGQSRLRLRQMRGATLAGFSAALGMGVNPAELANRSGR
jgi:hypothetical protein